MFYFNISRRFVTLMTHIEGDSNRRGGIVPASNVSIEGWGIIEGEVHFGVIEVYISEVVGHYRNTLFLVCNTTKQGNTKCRHVFNIY